MLALFMLLPAFALLAALGLSEWQLWLVTLVIVPVLSEIVRLISVQFGYTPTKLVMMAFISLVSVVMAALFNLSLFQGLPPIADGVLAWFEALIFIIGTLIGVAKIIYDILWNGVFDKLAKAGVKLLSYRLVPKT